MLTGSYLTAHDPSQGTSLGGCLNLLDCFELWVMKRQHPVSVLYKHAQLTIIVLLLAVSTGLNFVDRSIKSWWNCWRDLYFGRPYVAKLFKMHLVLSINPFAWPATIGYMSFHPPQQIPIHWQCCHSGPGVWVSASSDIRYWIVPSPHSSSSSEP